MKRTLCLALALTLLASPTFAAPVKALIVDGQNNHDWKSVTPVLRQTLLDSGRFSVDLATSPPEGGDMTTFNPKFADYDVIVLNYTGDSWNAAIRDAFVQYVREGGGVVVVHAADNAFADWPEYNEIIGFGGWGGRTKKSGPYVYWKDGALFHDYESDGPAGSHEGYAEIVVTNRVPDHPILKGMPHKWYQQDELYNFMRGPGKNMTILATAFSGRPKNEGGSGRHEPMLFTINYGKGNVFHTALGHDARSLRCEGFALTFVRGAEWVATGAVTIPVPEGIPAVLTPHEAIGALTPNASTDSLLNVLTELGGLVDDPARRAEIEKTIMGYLDDPACDFLAVQAACNTLGIWGTEKSIPALANLLTQEEPVSGAARLALERMPYPEAGQALVAALSTAPEANRAGIINSLGERREAVALKPLQPFAKDADAATRNAAIRALGKIGTSDALAALIALDAAQDPVVNDALLDCGLILAHNGQSPEAASVFEVLLESTATDSGDRNGALQGLLMADPDGGMARVWAMLAEPDTTGTALNVLGAMPVDKRIVDAISARLDSLPAKTQLAIMPVLGAMGHSAALPKVMQLARGPEGSLKHAAVAALGDLPGNAESVDLLATLASTPDSPVAEAARVSLVRTPGTSAENAIAAGIVEGSPATRMELMAAVGNRTMSKATSALLDIARTASPELRAAAFGALQKIAVPDRYEELIALAVAAPDEVRAEAVAAVTRSGREVKPLDARSGPYAVAIRKGDGAVKVAFLPGLPDIGDATSLKVARKCAKSRKDAVRAAAIDALAQWKDPAAIDAILELAEGTRNQAHRAALMGAFANLLKGNTDIAADKRLAQCAKALKIGLDTEGKRTLLVAVGSILDARALELIEAIGKDPALAEDAKRATPAIKQRLLGTPGLSASHNAGEVAKAIDGNPGSRWSTGTSMRPGMWFLIDLRMRSQISAVELDTTRSSGDYPRGYEVYVSDDADNMGKAVSVGEGDGPVTRIEFPKPLDGRFIKIVQTGKDGLFWSIHELRVEHNPGFPEVVLPEATLEDLAKDEGVVTKWHASGPYAKAGKNGEQLFDTAFGPEVSIDFAAWEEVGPEFIHGGVVNLDDMFGGDNLVVYLASTIVSDKAVDATLTVGSDDGVKVWLNQKLVHANNAVRPATLDSDQVSVRLEKGDNTLLLKVVERTGQWGACARIVP